MRRLHFIDITFENGNIAHITLDDAPPKETNVHIEGLKHIVKVKHETYTMKERDGRSND
jgi:hypothetical protein